jgi:hypothetical protein
MESKGTLSPEMVRIYSCAYMYLSLLLLGTYPFSVLAVNQDKNDTFRSTLTYSSYEILRKITAFFGPKQQHSIPKQQQTHL